LGSTNEPTADDTTPDASGKKATKSTNIAEKEPVAGPSRKKAKVIDSSDEESMPGPSGQNINASSATAEFDDKNVNADDDVQIIPFE